MIGLTVCVNYADQLAKSLPKFAAACDCIFVVTDNSDTATLDVCLQTRNAMPMQTDLFYADGAAFNKGRALDWAFSGIADCSDWVCVFDADIIPPDNWHAGISTLQIGTLYGAPRLQDGTVPIPDPPYEMPGYFWLFHTDDPHLPANPTFTSWQHAGNYDTIFKDHWPAASRVKLPFAVSHIGQPGQNWFGVGNGHKMLSLYQQRAAKGGYQHERV